MITTRTEVVIELRPCPSCGAFVALTPDQWERREKGTDGLPHSNANGGYMCPNGHQYGWGENETDRQRNRADKAEAETRRLAADRDGLLAQIAQQEKAIARVKRRADAGVCLHCHRTFQNVVRHMATQHQEKTTP